MDSGLGRHHILPKQHEQMFKTLTSKKIKVTTIY